MVDSRAKGARGEYLVRDLLREHRGAGHSSRDGGQYALLRAEREEHHGGGGERQSPRLRLARRLCALLRQRHRA